jgi:hypothetical protein
MTGQEKVTFNLNAGDRLIEVTTWAALTVFRCPKLFWCKKYNNSNYFLVGKSQVWKILLF